MNPQEYNIYANFLGNNVEINLKAYDPSKGENTVDFQGIKYSVTFSGIPEQSKIAKSLMFELRAALNEPTKNASTLTDRLLSHKIRCTQINTNEGESITKISKKMLSPIGSALFESAEDNARQEILTKLIYCNGSKDEIRKIFQNITPEHRNAKFLMKVALTLAEQGETVKSFHFFAFIQNCTKIEIQPHEKNRLLIQITDALLKYGNANKDVKSLDAAYYFLSALKYGSGLSPEDKLLQKVETRIQDLMKSLSELSEQSEIKTQKQAQELLNRIKINESIPPREAFTLEDVKDAREESIEVDEAFKLAEAYQNEIDFGNDPELAPPGRLIEIESEGQLIQMHVMISGQRQNEQDPLVILEAGNGCFSADWQQMQSLLEKSNPDMQVMSYDRAGMGWSQKGPHASLDRAVSNLKQLLKQSGKKPPYIIVGHSYGGFIAQLYALKHPQDIQGIVLVDSAIEEHIPQMPQSPSQLFDHLPPAVTNGFFSSERSHHCDGDVGFLTNKITTRTNHFTTLKEELADWENGTKILKEQMEESQEKNKESKTPFTFPLKVISRGIQEFESNQSPEEMEEEHRRYASWLENQKQLIKRSNQGELIIASESDHFIMWNQPEKIIQQIQAVFAAQSK